MKPRTLPLLCFRAALRHFFCAVSLLFVPLINAQTWTDQDVGVVGIAGSSIESEGTITLRGSGADIWGVSDGFHFRATTQTGNGAVVVRVTTAGSGHAWAKVGLMMREDLTPGAKAVLAYATPGNHVGLQARATAGDNTVVVADSGGTTPVWLLLDRVENVFEAYRSTDGENWTRIGRTTVTMSETIYVGLAVSSHNNAVLQVATLDNFAQLDVGKLAEPTNLRITERTAYTFGLAWDDNGGGTTAFQVERSSGSDAPFAHVGTTAVGATVFTDTTVTPSGIFRYRVRAVSEGGASIYSNIVMGQTAFDPFVAAPSNLHVVSATSTALQLGWTDNSDNETQFELSRRQQGAAEFTVIALPSANSTSYHDTGLLENSGYDYRLRAVRNGVFSAYATLGAGTTLATSSNWAGGDIGVVNSAGQTQVGSDGNAFTLVAGGGDMWGSADALRLHYRHWNGDGLIAARVTGLTNTDAWAKAGVTIRATFDSTSPNATMVLTPGGNSGFQARTSPGGATTFTAGPRVSFPYWVGVSRAGNLFKGFVSSDGINWTQVGSAEIAMSDNAFIGVAACAHSSNGAQTTAVFDQISAPDWMPPPTPVTSWTHQTWGGTSGEFTPAGADVRVTARGGDIWGTSDSGAFVYQEWTGDVTLITRFDQFTPSNDWTKAGLMIRASGAANAANAFVAITHGHGQVFQSRVSTGAGTTSPQQNGWQAPFQWLKLVRNGDVFSGYQSLDNQATWTLLGTATIAMPETVRVGLAISSHTNTSPTTAGFVSVLVE